MGRIYEALGRAADTKGIAPSSSSVTPEADVFSSPWTFVNGPQASPNPALVAPGLEFLTEQEPTRASGLNLPWATDLAVSVNSDPLLAEQFRFLGASLHRAQAVGHLKCIMVTSASQGDGKTLTALNLSLILSESYRRRVLLIDGDLRRPSIQDMTRVGKMYGLSECLRSRTDQKLSVLRLSETLTLLPAGRPDPDPMSTLTSPRMKCILEEAAARFDWVVLDTPPVGAVADAGLLAAMTDAVLFVVRAGQTRYPSVQRCIAAIGRDRVFGIVLNGVERVELRHYEQAYSANVVSSDKD